MKLENVEGYGSEIDSRKEGSKRRDWRGWVWERGIKEYEKAVVV